MFLKDELIESKDVHQFFTDFSHGFFFHSFQHKLRINFNCKAWSRTKSLLKDVTIHRGLYNSTWHLKN